MPQDVDSIYPALSSLAQIHQKNLNGLAKSSSKHHNNYLGLADCCYAVFHGLPRWANADSANYLATLNEYVQHLNRDDANYVWNQLTKGNKHIFLDTVVEAAWYLYYKSKGFSIAIHVPFKNNDPKFGDVDFQVTDGTTEWLFDVYSLGAERPVIHDRNVRPFPVFVKPLDDVVKEIGDKVRKKFHNKFPSEVRSGEKHLGLLVCIIKIASSHHLPLVYRQERDVLPPPNLFSEQQKGLQLVIVHTLSAPNGSEILQPVVLCEWRRE
jgi:hypothetical protein